MFVDFIEMHHNKLLPYYNAYAVQRLADGELYFEVEQPKNVFAEIWAHRTSGPFQHNPKFFLFGIIVRGFKDTDKILRTALEKQFTVEKQLDDEGEDDGF
jgi:hypothetical protein